MAESKSVPTFDFNNKSWNTDFNLVAEGKKFYIAKNILALASPSFKQKFLDIKVQTSDEFVLKGKLAEDLQEFLFAVYPSTTPALSKEQALKVLPLAEEFQVDYLTRRCEDVLLGSIDEMTPADELFSLFKTAHQYTLSSLCKRCIDLVFARPMDEIKITNRNIVLPAEPLRVIIQNMISRIKELESSELQKSEDIETIKAWRKFTTTSLKRDDFSKLHKDIGVFGKSLMVTMNIEEKKSVEGYIRLLNIELKMRFAIENETIFVQLELTERSYATWNVFIQFVVVNRNSSEEHLSVNYKEVVNPYQLAKRFEIAKLHRICWYTNGFVNQGIVQIEVNMFI